MYTHADNVCMSWQALFFSSGTTGCNVWFPAGE